jgi:heme o synthase
VPLSPARATAAATDAATLSPESVPQSQPRARAKAAPNLLTDYMEFFKARVTAMVVITAWAGFYLGSAHRAHLRRRRGAQ